MQSKTGWSQWAESLRRHNLDGLAAWFLEAGAPLTVLGAQAIYMAQPFFGGREKSNAIAHMLEDKEASLAFADYLRDEVTP